MDEVRVCKSLNRDDNITQFTASDGEDHHKRERERGKNNFATKGRFSQQAKESSLPA